jgi:hypothetical protein
MGGLEGTPKPPGRAGVPRDPPRGYSPSVMMICVSPLDFRKLV